MKTTIHTLRHARTDFNEERRYAGTIDVPLSERGRQEVLMAAGAMEGLHFDTIITSGLRRTRETARLLALNGTPILRSRLCNERCFGVMEGLTWEDIQTLDPPVLMIPVGGDFHTVNPKGGEPFEEVWARARRFRDVLFRRHSGQEILVISHGVFLQMFHGVLRRGNCIESLAEFPANMELRRFAFSGDRLVEEQARKLLDGRDVPW